LKVVNIAHVFCASLRRSAIFKRIRDILTRVSDRVPLILFESDPVTCGFDAGVLGFCGADVSRLEPSDGVNTADDFDEVEVVDGSSFVCSVDLSDSSLVFSASTLSVDLLESSFVFSADLSSNKAIHEEISFY
jgi:hypothetical protein